jgi:hypothetical protein
MTYGTQKGKNNDCLGFQDVTAVTVKGPIIWKVTLCSLGKVHRHSSEISVNLCWTTWSHIADNSTLQL